MIDNNTKISATINNDKIEHFLLNTALDSLNENAVFLPLKIESIKKALQIMKELDFHSISIIERFSDAFSLVDKHHSLCKGLQEVNFILNQKKTLAGYNTYASSLYNLVEKAKTKPLAIFGNGAFLKTALFALYSFLPDLYTDSFKEKPLAKSLGIEIYPTSSFVGRYSVIVNTNPNLKLPKEFLDADLFIDFLPFGKKSPASSQFPKNKTISSIDIFAKQISEKILLLTGKYPNETYLKNKINQIL